MTPIAQLAAWRKARLLRRNQRLFARLYKDPASGMNEIVNAAGYRVGCQIAMGMLDRLKTMHCLFCPEIMPLRKHPMGMLCEGHFQTVTRKETTERQEERHAEERTREGRDAAATAAEAGRTGR